MPVCGLRLSSSPAAIVLCRRSMRFFRCPHSRWIFLFRSNVGSASTPFLSCFSLQRLPYRAAQPGATIPRAFPLQCFRLPPLRSLPSLLRFFALHRWSIGTSNLTSTAVGLPEAIRRRLFSVAFRCPEANPHNRAAPGWLSPGHGVGTAPGILSLRSLAPVSRFSGVSAFYPCVPLIVQTCCQ